MAKRNKETNKTFYSFEDLEGLKETMKAQEAKAHQVARIIDDSWKNKNLVVQNNEKKGFDPETTYVVTTDDFSPEQNAREAGWSFRATTPDNWNDNVLGSHELAHAIGPSEDIGYSQEVSLVPFTVNENTMRDELNGSNQFIARVYKNCSNCIDFTDNIDINYYHEGLHRIGNDDSGQKETPVSINFGPTDPEINSPKPQIEVKNNVIKITNSKDYNQKDSINSNENMQLTQKVYVYKSSETHDGEQIAGPFDLDEDIDLETGNYAIRVLDVNQNILSEPSQEIRIEKKKPTHKGDPHVRHELPDKKAERRKKPKK